MPARQHGRHTRRIGGEKAECSVKSFSFLRILVRSGRLYAHLKIVRIEAQPACTTIPHCYHRPVFRWLKSLGHGRIRSRLNACAGVHDSHLHARVVLADTLIAGSLLKYQGRGRRNLWDILAQRWKRSTRHARRFPRGRRKLPHFALESHSLCRLNWLKSMHRFVCEAEFRGEHHRLTEYEIAVSALRRRQDFSPSEDSTVRTRAFELRQKLER